ncbi:MAG: Nmad2 family putative nucleotide modification protein [bacterium]
MNLYSYILTYDSGFAPNPFFGYCTLATCKPVIRRTSDIADWIFGLSPKNNNYKLIYAMEITEKITFADYFIDCRFQDKKPNLNAENYVDIVGDNIYKPSPNSTFQQLPSLHSDGSKENIKTKERDLSGNYVLISDNFYYFGSKPIDLPHDLLQHVIIGQGHRKLTPDVKKEVIGQLLEHINKFKKGIHACPTVWPPICEDSICKNEFCCDDPNKCDAEYKNDSDKPNEIIN